MIAYHYTALDALLSIVEGAKLRLTNALQLNDHTERRWIIEVIRTVAKEYAPQFSAEFWNSFYRTQGFDHPVFTISFSLEDDALSQWRAYANDGSGVSIGIDLDQIAQYVKTDSDNIFEFWSDPKYSMVEYNPTKQTAFVRQVFDWGVTQQKVNWFQPALASTLWNKLNVLGVKIKHPKFNEEKEARIIKQLVRATSPGNGITYDNGNILWTIGKYGLTQRTEVAINPQICIRRIVVGPKLRGNSDFIRMYLEDKGITTIDVSESSCPYR